jgi:hypothetical protein
MPALVAGIHVLSRISKAGMAPESSGLPELGRMDYRRKSVHRTGADKPGHDDGMVRNERNMLYSTLIRASLMMRSYFAISSRI